MLQQPGASVAERLVDDLGAHVRVGGTIAPAGNRAESWPLLRVSLLGDVRATTCFGEDALPRSRKARGMLAYLALARGEPARRSKLAALLWDRVSEQQARTSLRQAVQQVVERLGALAPEVIVQGRDEIALNTRLCWVDANVLADRAAGGRIADDELALLGSGQLLDDLEGLSASFDHWIAESRCRLAGTVGRPLEEDLLRGARRAPTERAIAARRLLAVDPMHEGASRELMRALAETGQEVLALKEYERLVGALARSLDASPSSETRALERAIRFASRPGADAMPRLHTAPQAVRVAPFNRSRLRVGVLPFLAVGGEREGRLARAVAQEIAGALARFRWFDVIAPVSLSPSREALAPWAELVREVDMDYVVDGTLCAAGPKIDVGVQLYAVDRLAHAVWSERVEVTAGVECELHDGLVIPLAARIDPAILSIEGRKAPRAGSPEALSLILQAIPLAYDMRRSSYEQAGRMLEQALAIEPDHPIGNARAGFWHVFHVGQGWSPDVAWSFAKADEACGRALRVDPDNAEALAIKGHIAAFFHRDFDAAQHAFDRSLRLNPSLAFAWALSAPTQCYVGAPRRALERLDRYRSLAPFDPYFPLFETIYTMAHAFAGDYEQGAIVGRRSVRANPTFTNGYKPLLMALGHLGLRGEASTYLESLLRLDPAFSLVTFARDYPFARPEDRERYMQGLRLAGVPEG
jgi:DNA-binding SARP family transcriptional activator